MSDDTPSGSPGFDDLLAAVAPAIGEEVTKLLRNGKPLSRIAGWFELSGRGSIRGVVGDRVDLARRVLLDDRFSPSSLAVLLEGLRGDAQDELPILLLVEMHRGAWRVGVRRIRPRHRSPRFA